MPPRPAWRSLLAHTGLVTRLAAAAYVAQAYGANLTVTVGPSMLPTLNASGDVLLVDSLSPRLRPPAAGHLVVATKPTDPRMSILKRVVEPPPAAAPSPPAHVWLEGDNPAMSTDSRHYGHVPRALIRSRVRCRVWPPSRVGPLPPRNPATSTAAH